MVLAGNFGDHFGTEKKLESEPVNYFYQKEVILMNDEYSFCEHCGEKIGKGASICPYCGYATAYMKRDVQSEEDIPSGGMNALSFFIPLVGIILYFSCRNETPVKAASMLKFAIIGICVGVGMSILIYAITYAVTLSTISSINRAYGL